jgi:hypothetical protein
VKRTYRKFSWPIVMTHLELGDPLLKKPTALSLPETRCFFGFSLQFLLW